MKEIALILHAGAEALKLNAELVRQGIIGDSPSLALGSALSAMRDKAIGLYRLQHPPIVMVANVAPEELPSPGTAVDTEWRAMLDQLFLADPDAATPEGPDA